MPELQVKPILPVIFTSGLTARARKVGTLGFYIVSPAHRGKGYGLKVLNAGIDHLKDLPCVGLDGVLD